MSDQRRKRRFQALGVPDSLIEKMSKKIKESHDPSTFDQNSGQMLFIIGDVGAGKTECAEEIFRKAITKARNSKTSPVPIWLSIYDIKQGPLEKMVKEIISLTTLEERGALIVIDGLDEQLSIVPQILEKISSFAAVWEKSYVISTSRPSVLLPAQNSKELPPLTKNLSIELIQLISGTAENLDRSWPKELQELVQRPLFAIIAAKHLHELGPWISVSQLLDVVIQDSLKGTRNGLTTSALERLALEISRAGKPVDLREHFTIEEISILKTSPLLTISGFVARFTLVSFQQWLGAQAIISGAVTPQEFSQEIIKFDQWRYSVAIAVSSAQPGKIDEILKVLARDKPGAAAWVISEVERTKTTTSTLETLKETTDNRNDPTTRCETALESLLFGLGFISGAFTETRTNAQEKVLKNIGIHAKYVQGNQISLIVVEGRKNDIDQQEFQEILSDPKVKNISTYFQEIENHCWPWKLALDVIQNRFSANFEHFLIENLPLNSICSAEIYRHLFSENSTEVFTPEKRAQIRKIIHQRTLDCNESDPTGEFNEEDLLDLLARMEVVESATARWPEINFDFKNYEKNTIVDFPSIGFRERVNAILAGSLDAYQELTDSLCPNLSDTLRTRVILPARFEGTVTIRPPSRFVFWTETWLTHWLRPGVKKNSADINTTESKGGTLMDQWEEKSKIYFEWLKNHPEARMAAGFQMSSGEIDFLGPCPASVIAIEMLWDDLTQVGFLKKGSRPKLKGIRK